MACLSQIAGGKRPERLLRHGQNNAALLTPRTCLTTVVYLWAAVSGDGKSQD